MAQSIGHLKKKKNTSRGVLTQTQDTKLLSNLSSPQRFKEGGAAILQALNINYQRYSICQIQHAPTNQTVTTKTLTIVISDTTPPPKKKQP
jgi:hypothetical protein